MRKVTLLALIVLFSGCAKVPPGYEGIIVKNYGSQRGVQDFPIRTGRVTYNPLTEDLHVYPTFGNNFVWDERDNDESISFNDTRGIPIDADVGVIIRVKDSQSPALFLAYRKDLEQLIHSVVWNEVRDAFNRHASTMDVMDIIGPKKGALLDAVKLELNTGDLAKNGLEFEDITFVSDLRLDEQVTKSINQVIEAQQQANQAEQRVRQSEALARSKAAMAQGAADSILTIATAQAEANRILAQSLTDRVVEYQSVQKWDGVMPQVTSGAVPFINLAGK